MVLAGHSTTFIDDTTGKSQHSEGFVYSCKGLLKNIQRQVEGCGHRLAVTTDTTFNIVSEGWCLYSVGCRTLYRSSGEQVRQKYRPFAFLLSRTERGDGYLALFKCLDIVRRWLDMDTFVVKAVCSDHHDGLIRAATEVFAEGEWHIACIIIYYPKYLYSNLDKNYIICSNIEPMLAPYCTESTWPKERKIRKPGFFATGTGRYDQLAFGQIHDSV